MRRRRLSRALWSLVVVLVFLSRDAGDRPYAPPGKPPYLTVFLLDGLSKPVFERELAAGRLPNIQKLILDGVLVENGIASFPSMTAYGFYPFITGMDAPKSNVLGLRWFERERARGNLRSYVGSTNGLMNGDFAAQPPTLYEHFADQHSFSINTYANRGVKEDVKIGWSFTMAKYKGRWWVPDFLAKVPLLNLVPTWEEAESEVVERAISDLVHRPKIQWLTLASIDAYQHVSGTDERYVELVRWADTLIGRYRARSGELGQEKDRIYAVITDHGVSDAKQNLDLRTVLAKKGLVGERDEATHLFESTLEQPLSDWSGADAVVVINGNMLNYLYFSDPEPTRRFTLEELERRKPLAGGDPVNVIELLLAEPGVELVIGNADASRERQVVVSARGRGLIERTSAGLRYTVTGDDPLGYDSELLRELKASGAHSADEWWRASLPTHFPDALHRIHELMRTRDVGDLVVTAAVGFDFGADYELFVHDYRGGHGGLRDDQLRVPYVLSGPGVARGVRIESARAEDVGRTFFELLHVPYAGPFDGRLLTPAIAH
jgi:hypothetical protein